MPCALDPLAAPAAATRSRRRPAARRCGLAAALVAAVLAACGGGDPDGPLEAPAADARQADAAFAAPARRDPPSPRAGAEPPPRLIDPRTQSAAAAAYLHGVNLFHDSKEEMLQALAEHAQAHPRLAVIRGYGWNADVAGSTSPAAADLDAVVGDRPVILLSADLRHAWRNSRALGLPLLPPEALAQAGRKPSIDR